MLNNSSSGTGASAFYRSRNNLGNVYDFGINGGGYTTAGGFTQGYAYQYSNAPGVNIMNDNGSGSVNYYIGGTASANLRASINTTGFALYGSSSGTTTLKAAAAAGSTTITLPAGTTDFSATGGAGQFVKQASAGGALTVIKPAKQTYLT